MEDKIKEILNCLDKSNINDVGLFSGLSGHALLFYEYSKINSNKIYIKKANKVLTAIAEHLITSQFSIGLSNGLLGIGWLFSYLHKNNFITTDLDVLLENVDKAIDLGLELYLKAKDYDFMYGILGFIIYYNCRSLNDNYKKEKIGNILSFLENTAEETDCYIKWKSILNIKTGEVGYNISLSHGISSIIVVLSKLYKIQYYNERIEKLLQKSLNYLLSQKIDEEKYGSFFPIFAIESGKNILKSRLAWCYGDLGIAMALWQAGIALNNEVWKNNALEVLLFAAEKRRNLKENFVIDTGLCHGTAGIGHIFYRMWWNTRLPEFKKAADYWFGKTMKMAVFEDGLAGYKTLQNEWVNDYSLLNGITGIGLALLTYYYEIEPAWDECLLLS